MFHVGQLVVCIFDGWEPYSRIYRVEIMPNKGVVYTVRAVTFFSGECGIRLCEIHNLPRQYAEEFTECSFLASRFRPVDPLRLSIFTAMLEDAPEPVAPLVTA